MLNKTYSILMAGTASVPNDFPVVRPYTVLGDIKARVPLLPEIQDPYLRALTAEHIIQVSKFSSLFPIIEDMDPSNTYDVQTPYYEPCMYSTNCTIQRVPKDLPVYYIQYSVDGAVVLYTLNGYITGCSDMSDDGSVDILGVRIRHTTNTTDGSVTIRQPYSVGLPNDRVIMDMYRDIPKNIRDNIDLDNYADMCASICLYVLNRYDG